MTRLKQHPAACKRTYTPYVIILEQGVREFTVGNFWRIFSCVYLLQRTGIRNAMNTFGNTPLVPGDLSLTQLLVLTLQ
jgi:hypothetical protein